MRLLFLAGCMLFLIPTLVQAQITEDNTLSTEVNTEDNLNFTVDAGERGGSNLFHSFTEFSVPSNGSVFFNNGATIQNIITRVTGASISTIDGLIQANGTANLFLLNPNGIVFGENARLDIGGSFLATTAESITFADGTEFDTQTNNSSPLLTVSVPLGLQFGSNPGDITNQANFQISNPFDPSQNLTNIGFTGSPNQTLALIGGNITFEAGAVTASGGNIELGSVAENSFVALESIAEGWKFNYDQVTQFRDIQFNDLSLVDVSGEGSGNIQIRGRNIQINDGSAITANTTGNLNGGKIVIGASGLLEIKGSDPTETKIDFLPLQLTDLTFPAASQISSSTLGGGKAGDVKIIAQNLRLIDGGAIELQTLLESTGAGGNLSITVFDSLTMQGVRPLLKVGANARNLLPPSISLDTAIDVTQASEISTASFGSGNAGNIEIITGNLSLRDGATIATSPFALGNGGDIDIGADTIEILGTSPRTGSSSSQITANTFGVADAGNLKIDSDRLIVQDGGLLISTTDSPGNAGDININTSVIEISGFRAKDGIPSLISTQTNDGGQGGNIKIDVDRLSISDRAVLSVQGSGQSIPGNLTINANSIELNNFAQIAATTEFQSGGNIFLDVQDNLTLNNNSSISAQAFGNANGGNLDLTVGFLVANPNENNDILATAIRGDGGNVTIRGRGIFGIEERLSRPPNTTNDIDASSEFGRDGTVTLEFADFGEFRAIAAGFRNFVNLSNLLNSGFCDRNQSNGYSILGKGGIAVIPENDLSPAHTWSDWRFFETMEDDDAASNSSSQIDPANVGKNNLAMIQGWFRDANGQVVLTSNSIAVTPHSAELPVPSCPDRLK